MPETVYCWRDNARGIYTRYPDYTEHHKGIEATILFWEAGRAGE